MFGNGVFLLSMPDVCNGTYGAYTYPELDIGDMIFWARFAIAVLTYDIV
jgi:hypothetical protein